jgi:hypothetical protein
MNQVTALPLKQLDKALAALRSLGLLQERPEEAPIAALIERIADLDRDSTLAIARTLSQATLFNEVVREQIGAMQIGQRYQAIANAFDSIRDDAKKMVAQVEDGKVDTYERLSNVWMKVTRGDIPDRFAKIKKTYLDVTKDSADQIRRERVILDAYRDFRGALKESQVLGFRVLKRAEEVLAGAKAKLDAAAAAVATGAGDDKEKQAMLELARDVALRALQDEDKRYQIAKDLAENLGIAYNTTDVIMARLMQLTDCKERVYSQSITFFGTNETVFTALAASFTGMHGLHESTRTLEAMKTGMNKSLETLAELGNQIGEEALRAGYGPTLRAESVAKLVEAVVGFQERSRTIVEEMRGLSERNERDIHAAVEDGRRRMTALVNQTVPAKLPVLHITQSAAKT